MRHWRGTCLQNHCPKKSRRSLRFSAQDDRTKQGVVDAHQRSGSGVYRPQSWRSGSCNAARDRVLHPEIRSRSAPSRSPSSRRYARSTLWDGFKTPGALRFAAELAYHSDTAVFTVDRLGYAESPYDRGPGSGFQLTPDTSVETTHETIAQIRGGSYEVLGKPTPPKERQGSFLAVRARELPLARSTRRATRISMGSRPSAGAAKCSSCPARRLRCLSRFSMRW